MMVRTKLPSLLLAAALAGAAVPAGAAPPVVVAAPGPDGVLNLAATATVEVPNDWMTVEFTVEKDGADAAAVQARLKEALAAALAQAQHVGRPGGQVEVQGGGFSLQPRLDAKGRIAGWTGSTSMWVQGRDMAAIADLAGRVATMTVGRLDYGISREAREKVEGEVAAQAIARFRARAAEEARAFGYGGYVVREVNVQTESGAPPIPRPMVRMAAAMAPESPLPVAAGRGSVTATVNGSVQMK
ncbi:MAG TPA: SIMPL domain-containing protein [Burkholderiaceae bacterium]